MDGGQEHLHDPESHRLLITPGGYHAASHLKLRASGALQLLYPQVAQRFAEVEAGCMLALMEKSATALGISLRTSDEADDSTLMTVEFATPLEDGHPRNLAPSGESKIRIFIYIQHAVGSLPEGLYEYADGALTEAHWHSKEAWWTLQSLKGDAANIIYDAAFVMILFSDGSRAGHIATGKFLQVFMLEAARKLGLCPLGRIGLPSDFPAPANQELVLAIAGGTLDSGGSAEAKPWKTKIFEHLQDLLPIHMVPQPCNIFLLPEIPLTASCKLDRKALPNPERSEEKHVNFTSKQERLAALWREVGVVPVSASCDFLANGGDSQKLRKLRHLVGKEFGLESLSINTLFRHGTLQRMTEAVHAEAARDGSGSTAAGSRRCKASKAQMGIFKANSQQGLGWAFSSCIQS